MNLALDIDFTALGGSVGSFASFVCRIGRCYSTATACCSVVALGREMKLGRVFLALPVGGSRKFQSAVRSISTNRNVSGMH